MRLDKYLKVARIIKRRTVANEACDNERVTVNGRVQRASYDVKVGDIIVTSGIGGVFPKGLPLGTVSSVEKSANDVYYTIVVRAQTTAENNEEVLVITSLTDEQSASDEDVSTANSTPQGTSRDAATKTKDESSDDSSDTSDTTDSGSSE